MPSASPHASAFPPARPRLLFALAAATLPAHAEAGSRAPEFEQQVLFRADQDPGGYPASASRRSCGRRTTPCWPSPRAASSTAGTPVTSTSSSSAPPTADAPGDRSGSSTTAAAIPTATLAPVVDRTTGRILLVETYNAGRTDAAGCAVPCARAPHLQYSDDGRTWSTPRDLSADILPPDWNSWYATGPVHGIQLTGGSHPGRLVVGVNAETWDGERSEMGSPGRRAGGSPPTTRRSRSRRRGSTWKVGATDTWPVAATARSGRSPRSPSPNAPTGRSWSAAGRRTAPTSATRTLAVSRDGGDGFAAPFRHPPDLYTPQVQGAVLASATGCCCPPPPTPTAAGR
ncbi:glycoside hydrolase [Streptomyces thinghirensis]|nr:glycoside hydrolase [Streptomyces thinghirensis]